MINVWHTQEYSFRKHNHASKYEYSHTQSNTSKVVQAKREFCPWCSGAVFSNTLLYSTVPLSLGCLCWHMAESSDNDFWGFASYQCRSAGAWTCIRIVFELQDLRRIDQNFTLYTWNQGSSHTMLGPSTAKEIDLSDFHPNQNKN